MRFLAILMLTAGCAQSNSAPVVSEQYPGCLGTVKNYVGNNSYSVKWECPRGQTTTVADGSTLVRYEDAVN